MSSELAQIYRQVLLTLQASDPPEESHAGQPSQPCGSVDKVISDFCGGRQEWVERLAAELNGLGPLESVIQDESITEFIVNGPDCIWMERDGELRRLPDQFLSAPSFDNFIHRLSAEAQVSVDLNTPCVDSQWCDFRLHIIRPPLSPKVQVSLRRHPRQPWTLTKLHEAGWACHKQLAILGQLIRERRNFLIVGPTSSGKTSVLNACLHELAPHERVVCIEDTSELKLPNEASCKLLTRHDANGLLRNYDLSDLVRQSLRMRPARIVMGEVRGPEAKDLVLALATGHSGSIGTLHASNARQALIRLEMLVQLGAQNWRPEAIRQLIHLSLEYIVVVTQQNGNRRLEGIYKIAALEQIGFLLERVEDLG